jgi:hypothetical protein
VNEPAFYLIKLATYEDQPLFGTMVEGRLELNSIGQVAADEWRRSAQVHHGLCLDAWEMLPHQIQGILMIRESAVNSSYGAGLSRKPRLLSSFIAGYKAAAAKRINLLRNHPGAPVWQRSYQERLLPDDIVLQRVRHMLTPPQVS